MGVVIELKAARDIHRADTAELKAAWDKWSGDPDELVAGFDHEAVYWELNRRGEGRHCAV